MLTEHLAYTLKAKNNLSSFRDKMRSAAGGDSNCAGTLGPKPCNYNSAASTLSASTNACASYLHLRPISKLEGLQKEFEGVYEEMADAQAEGKINGFSDKLL